MPDSTTIFPDSDMDAVREAIEAVSGRLDAAEALHALAGIRQQLEECVRLTEERMAALSRGRRDREPVVPDTNQPRTAEGLARAFDGIGQRVADEDASLSTDPDDYPLF
jgi:hypothetical protein